MFKIFDRWIEKEKTKAFSFFDKTMIAFEND